MAGQAAQPLAGAAKLIAETQALGVDALHLTRVGEDVFYATNFTKEELEALPDFDSTTVLK